MTGWLERIYREVDAKAGRNDHAEGPARRALLTGIWASALLLIAGLLLALVRRETRPEAPPSVADLAAGLVQLRGVCLVYAGLLALAATPVLRVAVMIGVYARRREWFMVTVSAIVLALLATSLILGTG